ncbi:restriction endonuclease subunit S [Edwardsiella tarda]|uniref:restriction endonuclease subunit S n=1 Tax=Edwardsiella tarda TaxID=636 RepID=UPI00063BF078|nr:restriction endonuclease subunit S [Edwardsiella tarda]AKH89437.1 restriction endonuclease subunit S [Edwardsiella tarda]
MSEWSNINLASLLSFGNGKSRPLDSGNIPVYGGNGIMSYVSHFNYDQETIIIGRVGAYCGATYYENKPIWISDNALSAKAVGEHNTKYLYYLLKNLDLNQFAEGSSHPLLTQKLLNSIETKTALNPKEQKSIASVLSSLDDKIDLLHCQNKTLESMAETLFRQWFILDITGVSVSIDQIIDFNPKRTLIKSQDATYLDMAGLSTDIFRATGYYKRRFSSGTKFTKQDTLLARITPCLENGKAAYIDFLDDNETGWGSTEFIVMRPKKEIHPLVSYIMCRNPDFKEYAESCMEGSTGRQRVNLDHLKKFSVNLPSVATLGMLNELLDSFESKLINNSKQIDSLEKLRDTLLPKLMSGEVRVQYAEEEISAVA